MIRCTALALIICGSALPAATPARPNVLFLFTDDQQADLAGAFANPHIHTPHIDRLVRDGLAFTRAHTMGGSSPGVCLPSRAMLLTGLTLWNLENQGIWGFEISQNRKTLPEVFRENGYLTFTTGKNDPGRAGHLGRAYSHGGRLLLQGMSGQFNPPLHTFRPDGDYADSKPVRTPGIHSAEIYADDAIHIITNHATGDPPFYAYVAFQTPHDPWQAPPEYHNTLIVFASDNAVDGNRHTQLFDLETDPHELRNLAESTWHQVVLTNLRALLETERHRLNDGNTPHEFTNQQGIDFWSTYNDNPDSF